MAKNEQKTNELAEELNKLLAAYQVAYFNIRAAHWMVKGENFFELHKLFEGAYNDATEKIDAIAERILTLGGQPFLTAGEMLEASAVKEKKIKGDEAGCVKSMLEDLTTLGEIEKSIVYLADEQHDIVTADLLTGYLGQQQKTSWMLYQFLNKKSTIN